jgi:hypothetical protein
MKRFICNPCNVSEKKLYEYQDMLDDQLYFSQQDKIGDLDIEIYDVIVSIANGFTVSEDDDLEVLQSWFTRMKYLENC